MSEDCDSGFDEVDAPIPASGPVTTDIDSIPPQYKAQLDVITDAIGSLANDAMAIAGELGHDYMDFTWHQPPHGSKVRVHVQRIHQLTEGTG